MQKYNKMEIILVPGRTEELALNSLLYCTKLQSYKQSRSNSSYDVNRKCTRGNTTRKNR